MTESARRSAKRDAGHPVWSYRLLLATSTTVSITIQLHLLPSFTCLNPYIVIPHFDRFAALVHNLSPPYSYTSTHQTLNRYFHFTNIHRSNLVHTIRITLTQSYAVHVYLLITILQQYDRFMFISILTFLCSVAVLEEYMFIYYMPEPDLSFAIYAYGYEMGKVLILVLVSFCYLLHIECENMWNWCRKWPLRRPETAAFPPVTL